MHELARGDEHRSVDMKCVTVRNVSKSFRAASDENKNSQSVLSSINLTAKSGEIYALIGASGCGKTTLISCILGTTRVDRGEIKIFNRKIAYGGAQRFASYIGYMPQEVALPMHLTILEILQFYANVHELTRRFFRKRLEMIFKLLKLPDKDSVIFRLSSGEQRRVSFAIAIIHSPKLLVLDEPTVGLDFTVREKIHRFLHRQANDAKVTVVMTTHYLSEAQKAHRCGFLRNGALIAEDTPEKILEELGVRTIDEAFRQLASSGRLAVSNAEVDDSDEDGDFGSIRGHSDVLPRARVIRGFVLKEFCRIKKLPWEIFSIFFLALICFSLTFVSYGRFPNDLKIAILANDSDYQQSQFLNLLNDVKRISYDSHQRAFDDFKRGQVFGIIAINSSFTKRRGNQLSGIEIHLDESKAPLQYAVKQRIFEALEKLADVSENRQLTRKLLLMKVMAVEGGSPASLTDSVLPLIAVLFTFALRLDHSIQIISEYRVENTWNRALVCGAKASEIFIAHTIQFILLALISAAQMVTAFDLIGAEIFGDSCLLFGCIFYASFVGSMSGFLMSTAIDNSVMTQTLGCTVTIVSFFLSGVTWPIECFPSWMLVISYALPVTLPANYLRDSMVRHPDVHFESETAGIVTMILWTFGVSIASYVLLLRKKFAKSRLV